MSVEADSSGVAARVFNHCEKTWSHVLQGDAGVGEYIEAGAEAIAVAAAVGLASRFGLARALCGAGKSNPWLPELSLAEPAAAGSETVAEAVVPAGRALARKEAIWLRRKSRFQMTEASSDIFEVDGFSANGVRYHNVDFPLQSEVLPENALVRTGPNLQSARELSGLPPHIPDACAIEYARKLAATRPDMAPRWQTAQMTKRELPLYQKLLEVPDEELVSGKKIADIGSGARQELAHSVQADVYSIDPGLALPEKMDLARAGKELAADRLKGRIDAHPLSLAAKGQQLPLADGSVNHAYASFSLPMYVEKTEDIPAFLSEVKRIVKPGGTARIYPVQNFQLSTVEKWIAQNRVDDVGALKFKPMTNPRPYRPGAHLIAGGHDYNLLTLRF